MPSCKGRLARNWRAEQGQALRILSTRWALPGALPDMPPTAVGDPGAFAYRDRGDGPAVGLVIVRVRGRAGRLDLRRTSRTARPLKVSSPAGLNSDGRVRSAVAGSATA